MSDLADDLQRFLDSASRPPSKDRRRRAAAAGGLALLAAVALGAVLWIEGKEETGGGEVSGAPANAEPGCIRALVIGVNRCGRKEVLEDLKYAEADAIEMSEVLRSIASKPEDVTLMATQLEKPHLAPRKHHTLRELQGIVRVSKPADTPIVSFAGREVLRRGDREYYLGLSDADPDDPRAMVTLTEVYAELLRAKAAFRLVLIDACRMHPKGDPTEAKVQPPEGVTVFFGCSAREVCFEDPDHRHGVFSYHLIEGLKGSADLDRDGKVTLAELEKFVKDSVPEHVRRRHKQSQNPELLGAPKEERPLPVGRMKSAG